MLSVLVLGSVSGVVHLIAETAATDNPSVLTPLPKPVGTMGGPFTAEMDQPQESPAAGL